MDSFKGADKDPFELSEFAPLTQAIGKRTSSVTSGPAYRATKEAWEETDYLETGFTLREIGPQLVRVWLGLQIVALCFQLLLWNEVSGHLWEFDDIVSRECSAGHSSHGVCNGPMWNMSSWNDFTLSPQRSWLSHEQGGGLMDVDGFTAVMPEDLSYTFTFPTKSSPPTFLLVVDPVNIKTGESAETAIEGDKQDLKGVRWVMEVRRTKPPQTGNLMKRSHVGPEAMTFEDLSNEAREAMSANGQVEWTARLTMQGGRGRLHVRFLSFVEDATTKHLDQVHASPQCGFGQAWKAFNEQHQGRNHRALSWCRWLLGVFLVFGGGSVYVVFEELKSGPMGFKFHGLVLAKFFLQDVPQQLCLVLYLLGWYEASGLRCQLCLFQPEYCRGESAFHITNTIAMACSLASCLANQLLIRPVQRRHFSEDDLCIQWTIRIGMFCISILPFTTGMLVASRSVLPGAGLMHLLLALPCALGWLALAGSLMFSSLWACDEDI